MKYLEAREEAEKCKHLKHLICTKRDKYRNCSRPLCCGFCPTVSECLDICILLKDELEINKNKE